MNDPVLRPAVRSEQQPAYEELREEYRAQNLARVRQSLHRHVLILRDSDGVEVKRYSTGFSTTQQEEHRRVDEWIMAGGEVPEFSSEFRIPECAGLDKELRDLDRDAKLINQSDGVQRPESAVETGRLEGIGEASLLDYIDGLQPAHASGGDASRASRADCVNSLHPKEPHDGPEETTHGGAGNGIADASDAATDQRSGNQYSYSPGDRALAPKPDGNSSGDD